MIRTVQSTIQTVSQIALVFHGTVYQLCENSRAAVFHNK